MSILLIHCRRGLFSLTICQDCGYTWDCANCSTKLTTYESEKVRRLICHQCQSSYIYPQKCASCNSRNISSKFGGIEELVRILEQDFGYNPIRFDSDTTKIQPVQPDSVAVSTRLFDPAIDYELFDHIVFLAAENLFANSDYLTNEEVYKSLAEVFLSAKSDAKIIFDTRKTDLDFFESLKELSHNLENGLEQINLKITDNLGESLNDDLIKNLAENLAENSLSKVPKNNPKHNSTENLTGFLVGDLGNNLEKQEKMEQIKPKTRAEIVYDWYNNLMQKEATSRESFRFPPFTNLLLLTTQEKDPLTSITTLKTVSGYLATLQKELPEITFGQPYEAKFFKRKNKFSHHLLIRYPRQYNKFARLKTIAQWLADKYKLQIRLNPRHLF